MREIMLILHFIGLAMGLGTGLAFMILGIASRSMEKDESIQFRLKCLALNKLRNTGLILLLVSGFYLITPYWASLSDSPLLIGKLILVILLLILVVISSSLASKARLSDPEIQFEKIAKIGKLALLTVIAIIGLAVYQFN